MTAHPSVAAVATALLLLVLVAGAFAGRVSSPSLPSPSVEGVVSDPCPGGLQTSTYSGTIDVEGGPASPEAGVAVSYSYDVQSATPGGTGGLPDYRCLPFGGTTTTNSTGGFVFSPPIPAPSCEPPGSGTNCTTYSGPYGPIDASTLGAPPPGYGLSVLRELPRFVLTFVWELSSITLSPAGNEFTIPPNDPATFTVAGWEANGSATPLAPRINWTLSGTGWSFSAKPSGAVASVIALPGASPATLTVAATATVDGTTLAPPPLTATLSAISTSLEDADLNRTTVDVGAPLSAEVAAVGAAGYSYEATIDPGLALPPVPAACATEPNEPGTVLVTCNTTLTYPAAGVAQPTANITNGFSAATWFFPDVTVNPPPALSVDPAGPEGYAGSPLAVGLSVAPGTGAFPYSEACLDIDGGGAVCEPTPGPTWTFSPTLTTPGDRPALAWVVDADGTNRSVDFPIKIVLPLALGPISVVGGNASAGAPAHLAANLSGGDLPARFWWNETGVAGPLLSGAVDTDGPAPLTFVPVQSGAIELSLTVEDALGTTVEVASVVKVGPSVAVDVALVSGPPEGSVVAGTPVPLSWAAFDGAGAPVRGFEGSAELVLAGPNVPTATVWVNGTAPFSSRAPGTFEVPASAWIGGVLDVSVTVGTAGEYELDLVGAGLPSSVPALAFVVVPDTAHVVLSDPIVAVSTERAASTYWQLRDRFGNAVPGAVLTVQSVWGGLTTDALMVAAPGPDNSSGLWINYSAPSAAGGSITVYDAAREVLLGPIAVPAAGSPGPPFNVLDLGGVAAVLAVGGATVAVVARRRSRRDARPAEGDAELRRWAEGRAGVLEILEQRGSTDLRGIEEAWRPAPAPPGLADWLASLVADGTLGAEVGRDGVARFCLSRDPAPDPQVTVDAGAIDDALRRREEALRDDGGPS